KQIQIAPDGAWIAFASERELVVVDRGGRELVRETAPLLSGTLASAASGKQLAVLVGAGASAVIEVDIDGGRASTRRIEIPWRVYRIVYVRDRLYANLRNAVQMRPVHDLDSR